ncbi:MAG: hypothetical protein U1E26_07750 [Coriobacteriia bacterium]|nr:hypothetical protein [Coriobacteriia bacterium]
MTDGEGRSERTQAKAVLLDPVSLSVLWDSESASATAGVGAENPLVAPTLEEVIPLADGMGLSQAIVEVAATGEPRRLSADVVSTSRGSVTYSCGVFLLPDGHVLVVAENGWRAEMLQGPSGRVRRTRTGR